MNRSSIRRLGAILLPAAVASLFVACRGLFPSAAKEEHAARLFNVGLAAMAEARFAEAQSSFDSARALAPGEAVYVLAAGQARMNQANYDTARALFDEAVALDSTFREGWYAAAFLALREGRNEDAITALHHCPDDASSQYLLGVACNRLDRAQEAVVYFRRSIELDPQFISAHYALAQSYQRMGQDSLGGAILERFTYLKDHGGTAIDLGGDIGTKNQGHLAETPVPAWRKRPIAEERAASLRIREASVKWPSDDRNASRTWMAARIIDLDRDGWDDIALAAEDGVRLWRNDGEGRFDDITEEAGLPERLTEGGGITSLSFGDLTGDGRPDLVVTQWGRSTLWRQSDMTRVRFAPVSVELPGARTATWFDANHDGLLDLLLVPLAAHHGPGPTLGLALWKNRGDGALTDISDSTGVSEKLLAPHVEGREGVVSVGIADWDQDGDVDLLLCFDTGGPMWLNNQHDGRFVLADGRPDLVPVALPTHLGVGTGGVATNVAIGDLVPNGWFDIAVGGLTGAGTVATAGRQKQLPSDTFPLPKAADGTGWHVRLADLDLDGDLDLLAFRPGAGTEVRVEMNQGTGIQWDDRTSDLAGAISFPDGVQLADVQIGAFTKGKLCILLVHRRGMPSLAEVQSVNAAARIRLVGGRSTREGIGAVVDVAQGHNWQRRLVSADGSGQSGYDLLVGLPRPGPEGRPIDMIRVSWTSGIRQSLLAPSPDTLITIVEKPGETSSCPFVYTWDGSRFQFIADAIGSGVLGVVVDPPSTYHQPDPDEYVLVRGEQLAERDGKLDVRITETLNEATLIDHVRLLAVAHPSEAEVYPMEAMPMVGQAPQFSVCRVTNARPIERAWDADGNDVTELLHELDRRYVPPGQVIPYTGFGTPHTLTLDLGNLPRGGPVTLVWDGWTSFWSSTSIEQAALDGVQMTPPRLEIPDGRGGWRTVVADLGVPAGKPKTIFTDLTGKLPPGVRIVRLVTSLLVCWDRVRVTTDRLDRVPAEIAELPLLTATLRYLGYPRPTTPDGHEPYSYDYHDLRHDAPWAVMPGHYTRYGPVMPLLQSADDRFVVISHGDEIALEFGAPPPVREGWKRDYLLYLNGYMKETIPTVRLLSRLDPLPFAAMSGYPYGPSETYPGTAEHRAYLRDYNTRVIGTPGMP